MGSWLPWVAALVLIACAEPSVDADRDGVEATQDCDDADPDVGAPFLVYIDRDGDGAGDLASAYPACDVPPGMSADPFDCDDHDPEVQGTWMYPDRDGDGYGDDVGGWACEGWDGWIPFRGDCDDEDPAINPAADEICNGIDDDCNGTVDPDDYVTDGVRAYPDLDGDGWGWLSDSVQVCAVPEGHVIQGGDCDDSDPAVNPGAIEVCNGIDDDCDKVADPPDLPDALTSHPDEDGDGWGTEAGSARSCRMGSRRAPRAGDCDPIDPARHPHAPELCNGVDDDCDGLVDEADPDFAEPGYTDADGDGTGSSATAVRSCTRPADSVLTGGDCDDADPEIGPHRTDSCGDGIDADCSGRDCTMMAAPEPLFTFASDWDDRITAIGDADVDGADDFALYASGTNTVIVLRGTPDGLAPWYEVTVGGIAAVAAPGDMDADGIADLWALAPDGVYLVTGGVSGPLDPDQRMVVRDSWGSTDRIAAVDWDEDGVPELLAATLPTQYVGDLRWFRQPGIPGAHLDEADAIIRPDGLATSPRLAVLGDVDGDGRPDVAWSHENAARNAGVVYLLTEPPSGNLVASDVAHAWYGNPDDALGGLLAPAGDLDGDGYADLAVARTGWSDEIDLYLDPLRAEGRWDADARIAGGSSPTFRSLLVTDLDGDDTPDIALGAANSDTTWIVRGPFAGNVALDHDLTIEGASGSKLGASLAAGDLAGDGGVDLLVLSLRQEDGLGTGAVHLIEAW